MNDPRFHPTIDHLYYWRIEDTTCPVFDPNGEIMGYVNICFDYSQYPKLSEATYEVSDVRYGQLGGLLIPEAEDIRQAIEDKLGSSRIIFPDKFNLEPKL